MTLQVIVVAFHRAIPLRIMIDCFLVQTDKRWAMSIVHDGETPQDILDVIALYHDTRITFYQTPQVNGLWGHPNRKWMLEQLEGNSKDYVLITNDDNYHVPLFVEMFFAKCSDDVGMVYCNTVHSYMGYNVLQTIVKENHIDMGSFIVRVDVAKAVGFRHMHEQADGRYAEECAQYCCLHRLRVVPLHRPLFIHN